jgi:hypothetical protein
MEYQINTHRKKEEKTRKWRLNWICSLLRRLLMLKWLVI